MGICVQPSAFNLHDNVPVGPMLSQRQPKRHQGKAKPTQVCDFGDASASALGPQPQADWQDAWKHRRTQHISQANLKQAHV